MKKFFVSAGVVAMAVMAITASAAHDDPVLMTVGGNDVHKSEFEYLYHKNNQQQLQPQSVDEYVNMFVDYKLKVADALAAGLDTTTSFRNEYRQFCNELASPYLADSTVLNELLREAYQHTLENVNVSHLMVSLGQSQAESDSMATVLNKLRQDIVDGKISWDEAVAANSIDRPTAQTGGYMGWIQPGRLPYAFEKEAYDTPAGQISGVANSGFGLHIIRVNERRPAPGEVKARHILKLTFRKSPEEAAKAKQQIDSIYNVLVAGADFADVATRESEDPGSARNGGDLGWFGPGTMVAEFDSTSFALKDGELSKPVETSYGYHIILREDSRKPQSYDEMLPTLKSWVNGDDRSQLPRRKRMEALSAKFNAHLLQDGLEQVKQLIEKNGGYDSAAIAQLKVSDIPVLEVAGVKTPVSEVMPMVAQTNSKSADGARDLVSNAAWHIMQNKIVDAERADMITNNPEYRNLVKEYRDGILLFDIANQRVWDKAAKDLDGLDAFFAANRDKYKWEAPKYKGYIIFATTDSLMGAAKQYCDSLDQAGAFDVKTFVADMRTRFGRDVKVERVLAAKGDNPISDYLIFDGPRPETDSKSRWKHYFKYQGHIAEQPEEVADVRGAVTTDYQNALERQWLDELHKKYKVKINKKVLKSVK